MELLMAFVILVAVLGLLDWAALRWGKDSRHMHTNQLNAFERRSNW